MTDRRAILTGTTLGLIGLALPEWVNAETALKRTLKVDKRYLNIPVKPRAPARHLSICLGDEVVREMSVELAPGQADYWVFMDLTPFKHQNLTLILDPVPGASQALKSLRQADEIAGQESIYHEVLRPQFHFSPKRGWMNDPNGLVYYDGEYHLFYQHYPYWSQPNPTARWQSHWGHAVSKDLIYWQELPEALYPERGLSIWSGSAAVDENNTAGFQKGAEKTLVALFTLADTKTLTGDGRPFTQGLGYSNDRGRTWTHYASNPVLSDITTFNRDPKVIWYAAQNKWVMVLFLDRADYAGHPELSHGEVMQLYRDKSSFGLFASSDLKHWEKLSEVHIAGEAECPEFYEIAIDGDPRNTRWIIHGAIGAYLIGTFDGITFTPESGPHRLHEGTAWYAPQTFNHIPVEDGRRIVVPWAKAPRDLYKDMPFNQSMGIPVELTLRSTSEGLRLHANPVRELAKLRSQSTFLKPQLMQPDTNPLTGLYGELLDVVAVIDPKEATQITFDLRGVPIAYDVNAQRLTCADTSAPLKLKTGRLRLRILVDRTSIEVFGNDGQLYQAAAVAVPSADHSLSLSANKEAAIETLEIHVLKSIWS